MFLPHCAAADHISGGSTLGLMNAERRLVKTQPALNQFSHCNHEAEKLNETRSYFSASRFYRVRAPRSDCSTFRHRGSEDTAVFRNFRP